jgi:hypothetical protein
MAEPIKLVMHPGNKEALQRTRILITLLHLRHAFAYLERMSQGKEPALEAR